MKRAVILCALIGALTFAGNATAASTTVYVYDDYFSPDVANIKIGDTVNWYFYGYDYHSTTSAAGQSESWNSGDYYYYDFASYSHTFTHSGDFKYYCDNHGYDLGGGVVGGMAGSVHVTPEPATIALSMAGIGLARRRKRIFRR